MSVPTNSSESVRFNDTEFIVQPSKLHPESMVLTDIGSAVMVQMKRTKSILVNPDTVREDMLPWLDGLNRWDAVPADAVDLATGLLDIRDLIDEKRRSTPEEGSSAEEQSIIKQGKALRDTLLGEGLSNEEVRSRLALELREIADGYSGTRQEIYDDTERFNEGYVAEGVGALFEVLELNGGDLIVPVVQKIRDRVQFDIRQSPTSYTAVVYEKMPGFVDTVRTSVAPGGSIWSRA